MLCHWLKLPFTRNPGFVGSSIISAQSRALPRTNTQPSHCMHRLRAGAAFQQHNRSCPRVDVSKRGTALFVRTDWSRPCRSRNRMDPFQSAISGTGVCSLVVLVIRQEARLPARMLLDGLAVDLQPPASLNLAVRSFLCWFSIWQLPSPTRWPEVLGAMDHDTSFQKPSSLVGRCFLQAETSASPDRNRIGNTSLSAWKVASVFMDRP